MGKDNNHVRTARAVYCDQRLYNTRQESARKMWGLRTIVHEDWNGSEGAPKHCLSTPGFIIKIKDTIIFINLKRF